MRRNRLLLLTALVMAFLLTGCFDIEQSLVLNKDMSGKAGFRMAIDFEPMVLTMLQVSRSMEGKKGPPSADEIAAAKKDFLEKSKEKPQEDPMADRKSIEEKLPKGITLVDASAKQDGMKITTKVVFGFTDPSKLALINMPSKKGENPSDKSVIDKPFDSLVIKDEGDTILITSKPADPMKGVKENTKEAGPGGGPGGGDNKEMEEMIKNAMKGLRVAFRIEAPFKVVESNATRKDGKALLWEYNLDSFEKMQKEGKLDDLKVMVRYKK
ncbi:MAG TPA: hypothetical protein VEZ11_05125 [Thermoanaerobaculia bacterium]|nr:hypothetical protein [Thermoanaerobaculia bacterium]